MLVSVLFKLKVIKRAYKEILKLPTELIIDKSKLMDLFNWFIESQSGIVSVFVSVALITNLAFWQWSNGVYEGFIVNLFTYMYVIEIGQIKWW